MTVRLSTSMIFQNGMKSMMESQTEVYRSQEQIATGKRLLSASDDPAASSAVLQLRDAKAQNEQYQLNADAADAQLAFQETVYGDITNTLQRVRDLIIQGNSDTTTQADRTIIAGEIETLRNGLFATANSKDINGDYLFAGNKADTIPFSEAAGGVSYQGDEGVRELKIGASRNIAVNDNGKDVFMKIPSGNGVFSASAAMGNAGTGVIGVGSETGSFVSDTYTIQFTAADPTTNSLANYEVYDSASALVAGPIDFESGDALSFAGIEVKIEGDPSTGDTFTIEPSRNNDIFTTLQSVIDVFRETTDESASSSYRHSAINGAFLNVDNAMERIEVQRTQSGGRLNAVEQQKGVNENLIFQGEVNISRLEDVDMVEAIMNFQMQLQALQAAQQSFSTTQQRSLFDFI